MVGYEHTPTYDPSLQAFHYWPDRSVDVIEPEISDVEEVVGDLAFELAHLALNAENKPPVVGNNPPIGAVLQVNNAEHIFGGRTHDKTSLKLNGHGEIVAYEDAHLVVGDDLSNSTLISTAVLCSSCTPPYAEGKIGKLITSAPRRYVWQLAGIMRPRQINQHELLIDGATDTISVINYRLDDSLALFALYGKLRGHKVPSDIDDYLRPFVERAYAA